MAWIDEQKIATTQLARGADQTVQPVVGDILIATSSGYTQYAISVPAANVRNALAIDNGETTPTWKAMLDAVNPADIAAAASPGTSLIGAHRDHVHAHPAFSSGDLHSNYLLKSLLAGKGYLVTATAASTPVGLAPGTDGFALTADSTAASGLKWASAGVTDHGALTGLVPDDDHTQYALLVGRAGGQTMYGGTAASNNLVLQATSHATAGILYLGSTDANAPRVLRDTPAANYNTLLVGAVGGIGWNDGSGGVAFTAFRSGTGILQLNADLNLVPTISGVNSSRYTLYSQPNYTMTANNTGSVIGVFSNAVFDGVGKTLSNFFGIFSQVSGGGSNPSITNVYGIDVPDSAGGLTIANYWGMRVRSIAGGSTQNVCLELQGASGATTNYTLWLSGTGGTAADGITFGTDVQLYRNAANNLSLAAGDALIIPGGAGDFGTPVNGMLWYNTTTGKMRVYEGGAWANVV